MTSITSLGAGLGFDLLMSHVSTGVEFIDENGGGLGVRLRNRERPKPSKLVPPPHSNVDWIRVSVQTQPQGRGSKRAQWHRPSDVKAMFGTTVDFVGDNRVVFDISGNKYRLVAHVAFSYKRVLIKFVGTHGEYDRIDAEAV